MGTGKEKVDALNNFFLHREVIIRGQMNRFAEVWGFFYWALYICSNTTSAISVGRHQTNQPPLPRGKVKPSLRSKPLRGLITLPPGVDPMLEISWALIRSLGQRDKLQYINSSHDKNIIIIYPQDRPPAPCWIMRFPAMWITCNFHPPCI
jgi:hypothetical protein